MQHLTTPKCLSAFRSRVSRLQQQQLGAGQQPKQQQQRLTGKQTHRVSWLLD